MCCATEAAVQQSDLALNEAQAAMTNQLNQDYAINFANYEKVMNQQLAKANYIESNPMGYEPSELHAMTTDINENTANGAKQAIGAAAAYAAAHGAADTGSGPSGMLVGQIASQAAQSKAAQLSALSQQNAALKRQNFWTAFNEANNIGSGFGTAAGSEAGESSGVANSAVGAGTGAVQAQEAGIQEAGSLMSGIGGLISAGTGVAGLIPSGGGAPPIMPGAYGGPVGGEPGDVLS